MKMNVKWNHNLIFMKLIYYDKLRADVINSKYNNLELFGITIDNVNMGNFGY